MAALARCNLQEGVTVEEEEVAEPSSVKVTVASVGIHYPMGVTNITGTGNFISGSLATTTSYCSTMDSLYTINSTDGVSPNICAYQYSATRTKAVLVWKGQNSYLKLDDGTIVPFLQKTSDIDVLVGHLDFVSAMDYKAEKDVRLLLFAGLHQFNMSMLEYRGITSLSRGTMNVAAPAMGVSAVASENGKESLYCSEETAKKLSIAIYRAMHFISDQDVEGVKELLNRVERLPRGSTGAKKVFTGITVRKPHLDLGVEYKNAIMSHVALIPPEKRVIFFSDLRKMNDKVFDYVICKFMFKVKEHGSAKSNSKYLPTPQPPDFSPDPTWDGGDTTFELFLEANRNHPVRYWADYLTGSHSHGFLLPSLMEMFPRIVARVKEGKSLPKAWGSQEEIVKALIPSAFRNTQGIIKPDTEGTSPLLLTAPEMLGTQQEEPFPELEAELKSVAVLEEPAEGVDITVAIMQEEIISAISEDTEGFSRMEEGVFSKSMFDPNHFTDFPKVSRLDITPLQITLLYTLNSPVGTPEDVNPYSLFQDTRWIWSPSLDRLLFPRVLAELRGPTRAWMPRYNTIHTIINDMNSYIKDGKDIYDRLQRICPDLVKVEGELSKRMEISAHNHICEQKLTMQDKLSVGGGSALKCRALLDTRVAKYRVRSREELVYLGSKLHHCIGTNSDEDALFFVKGTVCAKTDGRFTTIYQCLDSWNVRTAASIRFNKFLEKAIAWHRSNDSVIRYREEGPAPIVSLDEDKIPQTREEAEKKVVSYADRPQVALRVNRHDPIGIDGHLNVVDINDEENAEDLVAVGYNINVTTKLTTNAKFAPELKTEHLLVTDMILQNEVFQIWKDKR
jgi:hypothetical protein